MDQKKREAAEPLIDAVVKDDYAKLLYKAQMRQGQITIESLDNIISAGAQNADFEAVEELVRFISDNVRIVGKDCIGQWSSVRCLDVPEKEQWSTRR